MNKLDSDGMSMWILKSPVMIRGSRQRIAFSRKEENSSKNVEVTVGCRTEYGMRIHLFPIEIVQSADSKEGWCSDVLCLKV